jgi:AAA family ATP:ADP antiporter
MTAPQRTPGASGPAPAGGVIPAAGQVPTTRPGAVGDHVPGAGPRHAGGTVHRTLRAFVDVRADEVGALGWAWLYFFCVLSSYYVIRPIRDEMGVAGGVDNLPWLWMGTLAGMTVANPPFAALVARLTRVRFIGLTYRFFLANLVVFFALVEATSGEANNWVGRVFYVWTSIFNLFVVSVFWATLVDAFSQEQGKRLFGFVAAGATIGGIAGSTLTASLAAVLGAGPLLLVSALLLEAAVFAMRRLARERAGRDASQQQRNAEVIGGSALAGVTHALRSPYLLAIGAYMLLFTILSTFLYFQQASVASAAFTDRAARTQFFAQVDLAVNVLTLVIQLFLTGRLLERFGVPLMLLLLPMLTVAGFAGLGVMPTVAVIVVFQVLRRAGNFAVARPTREVLFTLVPREDRYKAKSFIDTFVYRAGDQVGAWSYALMAALGLGVAGVAWAAVPIAVVWVAVAWWIGRRHQRAEQAAADARAVQAVTG